MKFKLAYLKTDHLGINRHLCRILTILTLLISPSLFSSELSQEDVVKALTVRGTVNVELPSGEKFKLKEGDWLPEGTTLSTENRSFAKLLFIDRTQMNLAPNSEMIIESFSETDPGMISLMQGRIRSNVTRNYLEESQNSEESKLFIKTRNAAMGIRGTDFLVDHNPQQNATNLITFRGEVAMVNIDSQTMRERDPRVLDRRLNSPQAVRVNQGQGSSVRQGRTAPPRQIDSEQLERINQDPSLSYDESQDVQADTIQSDSRQQDSDQTVTEETSPSTSESHQEAPVEIAEVTSGDSDQGGTEEKSERRSRIPPGVSEDAFTSNSEGLGDRGVEDRSSQAHNTGNSPSRGLASTNPPANQRTLPIRNQDVNVNTNDLINDTRREQSNFVREQTEEIIREAQTRIHFRIYRED